MTLRIAAIHRYPVKGLSPERLASADLAPGAYFPGDRLYAVENGPSGFDPAEPAFQPKIKFLMLMKNGALARLRTRYLDETTTLVVEEDGREAARGDLSTPEGRAAIEAFFRRYAAGELRGEPRVIAAPDGFRFTDSPKGHLSIINLASVAAMEDWFGVPVDPLRFRGNLHVDGLEPWAELDLVDRVLEGPGGLRLKVVKRIQRCAATDVDPGTGIRDLAIPPTLMRRFGHMDCGIYCQVLRGGRITEGAHLALAPVAQPALPF
ncbi:MAG TPA: MOSC N-terminal beta barrel domain-containing protein [Salinarimonas sp.]|jgi:hypothetical protein|nr:MOSC N-terminal beta barrel domain-containing protein [Salinarimonas sp.]